MLSYGVQLSLFAYSPTLSRRHNVITLIVNVSYNNAVAYATRSFVTFSYNFNIKSPFLLSSAATIAYKWFFTAFSREQSCSSFSDILLNWSRVEAKPPIGPVKIPVTVLHFFSPTHPGISERDVDILSNLWSNIDASAPWYIFLTSSK